MDSQHTREQAAAVEIMDFSRRTGDEELQSGIVRQQIHSDKLLGCTRYIQASIIFKREEYSITIIMST